MVMAWRSERYLGDLIDVEPKTLRSWRLSKDKVDKRQTGPEFIRISHRCVRYPDESIAKWLAEQPKTPLRRKRRAKRRPRPSSASNAANPMN